MRTVLALSALLLIALLHAAQENAPPAQNFFTGTVTAVDDHKVTVNRTVLGKDSETRTFLVTPETRIEGRLRVRARVTVRFAPGEEGDRALHIIVRTSQKK